MVLNLPHASAQLNQTTISKRRANNDTGLRDIQDLHLNTSQDKGSQGETAKTQRTWVGELAVLDRLPETRLELTTESWETSLRSVNLRQRTEASVVGARGLLVRETRGAVLAATIYGVGLFKVAVRHCGGLYARWGLKREMG